MKATAGQIADIAWKVSEIANDWQSAPGLARAGLARATSELYAVAAELVDTGALASNPPIRDKYLECKARYESLARHLADMES